MSLRKFLLLIAICTLFTGVQFAFAEVQSLPFEYAKYWHGNGATASSTKLSFSNTNYVCFKAQLPYQMSRVDVLQFQTCKNGSPLFDVISEIMQGDEVVDVQFIDTAVGTNCAIPPYYATTTFHTDVTLDPTLPAYVSICVDVDDLNSSNYFRMVALPAAITPYDTDNWYGYILNSSSIIGNTPYALYMYASGTVPLYALSDGGMGGTMEIDMASTTEAVYIVGGSLFFLIGILVFFLGVAYLTYRWGRKFV